MIVMMIAITPSLNAVSRSLFMLASLRAKLRAPLPDYAPCHSRIPRFGLSRFAD
jgi:hypothetical protein